MGFALWIGCEMAWCQGRHEYQPMGVSVVSRTDLFRERDFSRSRPLPPDAGPLCAGLFASLGEVNAFLQNHRGRPAPVTTAEEKAPRLQFDGERALTRARSRSGRTAHSGNAVRTV
jgi:hypothetical protein